MKHGEVRNWREESKITFAEYVMGSGEEITLPSAIVTESVSEHYCETCGKWFEVRGIIGALIGCPQCGREW